MYSLWVCVSPHCKLTRKMSVQSFRMRSTQGSSSNMMEWEISLKNPRTNFPITKTTDTYRPMILEGGKKRLHWRVGTQRSYKLLLCKRLCMSAQTHILTSSSMSARFEDQVTHFVYYLFQLKTRGGSTTCSMGWQRVSMKFGQCGMIWWNPKWNPNGWEGKAS